MSSKFADIAPRIWSGIATDDELRSLKVADVIAIKSDEEHIRLRPCVRAKPEKLTGRRVRHVASDESADRMGDVIRVKGWDLRPFRKNPQLLFNHNHDAPLGQVAEIGAAEHKGAPALLSESDLYPDEKLTEERQVIARLAEDGDLPAVSVGFLPRKTSRPDSPEERQALGLGEWGVLYEKAELLELSVVTVPANSNALMRRLDEMVGAGTLAKSLAAQVAKVWTPSTRTVVQVAKITAGTATEVEIQPRGPSRVDANGTPTTTGNSEPEVTRLSVNGIDYEVRRWAPLEASGSVATLSPIAAVTLGTFTVGGHVVGRDVTPSDAVGTQSSTDQHLAEIKAALAAIQHTLSAELPALRAQLDSVTRGSADPASQRLPMDPEVQPAPDSRALKPEAIHELAQQAVDRLLAARKHKDKR